MKRIALISDTHINSRYCDEKALLKSIDEINKKSDIVLHAGDITDGIDVYRGHRNDMQNQRIDEIIEKTVYYFNQFDKPVFAILGNHDESLIKKAGIDLRNTALSELEQITLLGLYSADIEIEQQTFRLLHPSGSASYSISYPAQKYLRQVDISKFDWLILGHFHRSYYFELQGKKIIGLASYMQESPFSIRRGFGNEIGYSMLDLYKNSFKIQMRRFR